MADFYIPGLTDAYVINSSLIALLKDLPELFVSGVRIKAVFGSFPDAVWNGGRTEFGKRDINRCKQIIKQLNEQDIAVRYTFTNCLIEKRHLDDTYCNLLMDLANNGKNEVLVNSPLLEDYLRNKYPNFKYVLSTTTLLRDIDIVNKACEMYDMVVVDYRDAQNNDYLSNLKYKEKVELLVNETCALDCPHRGLHYKAISAEQLGFIENDNSSCMYKGEGRFGEAYILHDRLWNELVPMGFTHFKFKGRKENPILLARDFVSVLSPKEKQFEALTSILLKSYPF